MKLTPNYKLREEELTEQRLINERLETVKITKRETKK
jgi:hypothetical protein